VEYKILTSEQIAGKIAAVADKVTAAQLRTLNAVEDFVADEMRQGLQELEIKIGERLLSVSGMTNIDGAKNTLAGYHFFLLIGKNGGIWSYWRMANLGSFKVESNRYHFTKSFWYRAHEGKLMVKGVN